MQACLCRPPSLPHKFLLLPLAVHPCCYPPRTNTTLFTSLPYFKKKMFRAWGCSSVVDRRFHPSTTGGRDTCNLLNLWVILEQVQIGGWIKNTLRLSTENVKLRAAQGRFFRVILQSNQNSLFSSAPKNVLQELASSHQGLPH